MNRSFRHLVLVAAFAIQSACAFAQNCMVSGNVTDAESGQPLANVSFVSSTKEYHTTSGKDGHYSLCFPKKHNISLKISHVGYKTISRTINGRDSLHIHLDITLYPSTAQLDEVAIKGHTRIGVARGDTTVYRISKVNTDATLGDALSKIPGFRYENGQLEINGEQVNHLMLDGVDFFKGDIGMALKNLQANIVDQVEVFDKRSDYAELTGFDDGNSHKTINIKTKKGVETSSFGKAYAGYGTDERYKAYGMLNMFNNDFRWSLFTQWNNINEQNFSMIDLLSATGTASSSAPAQSPYSKNSVDNTFHPTASDDVTSMMVDVSESGITTSRAAGTNYSDQWVKGKMKVSGHYLFNSSSNNTDYDITDEYYGKNTSDNLQQQLVNTNNVNHRFNWKYEYNISPNDYLMIRPSLTYQRKKENSKLIDWTRDSIETALLLNQNTGTTQNVISNSDEVMYLHKLNAQGHSISFDARFSYIKTNEDIDMTFKNVQANQEAVQETYSYNIQKTYTGVASYVFPFNRHTGLKLDAGYNATFGLIKRKTQIMADDATEYSVDSLLCGSTTSDFGGFLGNLSYMYSQAGLNVVAGTEYHLYNFKTKNDITHSYYQYNTFLPFFVMRYQFGGKQLHVQYRTSQRFPGLMQVQDAINNANATMAVRGNSRLQAAYHHNMMIRLVMPNMFDNGSIGVFFANVEQADNYIASKRSLSSATFTGNGDKRNSEMFSYQNADGFFSASGLLAYGFPVNLIKSNMNISTMVQYAKTPGFWDEEKVYNRTWAWNSSVTISSNISEAIDFILDFNCKYNQSKNLTYSDYDVNYWSLSYGGQVNWQIIPSLKLVVECGHTNYYGSGTSRFNALISNAAFAWKFLKDRHGELRLSCNDIFNKNNNFFETTNEIYRREVTTNVLKRYALLTFTYNLNKQNSKQNERR